MSIDCEGSGGSARLVQEQRRMLEAEGAKHKGVNNLSCGEWKFTECLGGIADVIPNGSVPSTVAKRPLSP
ncbi:MAG: hypothetical protein KBT29_11805 [Prevotellaceae bacterium]|nr:hypothetical protein [Candidatus Minthosoma caballi]